MKYLVFATLMICSTAAVARQEYAAYEGRDAIQTGQGGTKVSKNGIDFWTTGAPPRRFQVLGILTDARKDRMIDGNVIGSKSVAGKVLEAGGNAVIVAGADTSNAGYANFGQVTGAPNGFNTMSHGRTIHRTTTRLIVIKYLED